MVPSVATIQHNNFKRTAFKLILLSPLTKVVSFVPLLDSLVVALNADGDLAAGKHLGSQYRGDAAEADGFALCVEGLQRRLHLIIDSAVLPLHSPCAQVLCCPEPTWGAQLKMKENQNIQPKE